MIRASYKKFELELKHTFSISKFSRNSTPILLLKLNDQGHTGYGEASMVPYMGESYDTALNFLDQVDWSRIIYPYDFEAIIQYLDRIAPGNPAIKAAIDIALNDLNGKIRQQPCYEIYGANPARMPATSFTIGIDRPEVIREKLKDAQDFKIIKVKLGSNHDKEIIETIRSMTAAPLFVDANQGWSDKHQALDLIFWLQEQGVLLIEQPMDRYNPKDNGWLTERSPIPLIADEAMQRFSDMHQIRDHYHGINVKLMKSTGMYEASKMIKQARDWNMKVLIGCMSETSCATLAAAALAPLCDWADLDGPFLTKNNPFGAIAFSDGKYRLSEAPGLGLLNAKVFDDL